MWSRERFQNDFFSPYNHMISEVYCDHYLRISQQSCGCMDLKMTQIRCTLMWKENGKFSLKLIFRGIVLLKELTQNGVTGPNIIYVEVQHTVAHFSFLNKFSVDIN